MEKRARNRQPLVILSLLIGLLVTSCMGDSRPIVTYNRLGIIREEGEKFVYTSDSFRISFPELEGMEEMRTGRVLRFDFKTVLNEYNKSEIQQAELVRWDTVPGWQIHPQLSDTGMIFYGETPLSVTSLSKSLFFSNRIFLKTAHTYAGKHGEEYFELAYNAKDTTARDSVNNFTYNLFLRFVLLNEDTLIKKNYSRTNAFDLTSFINYAAPREQQAGKQAIRFLVHTASRFNADTTAWIWQSPKDTFTIALP